MPTFAVEELPNPGARFPLYELLIDDERQLAAFVAAHAANPQYQSEIRTLQAYMLAYAQGMRMTDKKFKELKRDGADPIKDFEFRSKHLRVYLFQHPVSGRVVVGGGLKTEQDGDIARLRRLKAAFCAEFGD
jgi:hypothetical protein